MRPSLTTRLAWLDLGARAFAAACPSVAHDIVAEHGPVYICPLCVAPDRFKAFLRPAVESVQLTAEHAPPESAGGRAIVLTCAECNHTAGSYVDGQAAIARRLEGPVIDRPVRVARGDHSLNMTIHADATGIRLYGDAARNAPAAHAAFFDEVGRIAEEQSTNWSFHVNFHRDRFDPKRAAASWLRAAYIITFAKFGYRAILNPAFAIVREKIITPESDTLPLYSISVPDASEDARMVLVIEEPSTLAGGLAIQMGRHLVLLPKPGDLTFYDRVEARRGEPVQLTGTFVAWPIRPEFTIDMQADPVSQVPP